MKILASEYPTLGKPQSKLVITMLFGYFEYFLELGEDGICKEILEDQADFSVFPHVQKRMEQYLKEHSADAPGTT